MSTVLCQENRLQSDSVAINRRFHTSGVTVRLPTEDSGDASTLPGRIQCPSMDAPSSRTRPGESIRPSG